MRRIALLLAVALLAAVGCTPDFETSSIVLDLRVLGMQAEPPEVLLDVDPLHPDPTMVVIPGIHVTALIADPGQTRALQWHALACPPTSTLRCSTTAALDPTGPIIDLGGGTITGPDEPIDMLVQVTPELLLASQMQAPYAGLDGVVVQVELRVVPDGGSEADAVYAEKGLLFSARITPEQQPNHNPTFTELTAGADMAPWPADDCSLTVARNSDTDLTPVEDPLDIEAYQLRKINGGTQDFSEILTYFWFATAGHFDQEESTGWMEPDGDPVQLYSTWTAPDMAGEVRFWIVQRDERGGATWQKRCITVAP